MKKIILSLSASLLFLSQAANAEIKLGDQGSLGTIAFNAGYNTSYIWRGVDQNGGSGAPYIGADLTTPVGIYFGTWTSGAGGNGSTYSQEVDIYAGIKKTFGAVTIDLGVIEYRYPQGDTASAPLNFAEGYIKLNVAPDKAPFTIGVAYFEDDTKGNQGTTGSAAQKGYQEVNATYDFGMFQSFISYGEYKNTTDVTTLTLSKSLFDLGFALSYIDSQKAGSNVPKDREFLVLNVSKTF